jgi:hypothetical protein
MLAALIGMRDERVLVHELTHATFGRFHLPRWMNEGLALLSEERNFGGLEIAPNLNERPLNLDELADDALFEHQDLGCRTNAYYSSFVLIRDLYEQNPIAFSPSVLSNVPVEGVRAWMARNYGRLHRF